MVSTGTVISGCVCGNAFQDETYGKGHRVFNMMKTGSGRCTVCSREKSGLGVVESSKTKRVEKTIETGKADADKTARGKRK